MRIRTVKSHADKHGNPQYSARLEEGKRVGDKTKYKTLLNLGTNWPVPRHQWNEVVMRVEESLEGKKRLPPAKSGVERAADAIVAKLRAVGYKGNADRSTTVTVNLDTLEHKDVRTVGCERICLKALDDLKLAGVLGELGFSDRDARIAQALVMARMIHPAGVMESIRWLDDTSATVELLNLEGDTAAIYSETVYHIGDLLWKHRELLQKRLYERERLILDLPETVVFCKISNAPTKERYTGGGFLGFGQSEQRSDGRSNATLALMLDGAGFPRSCEILPGKASKRKIFEDAIGRLADALGTKPNPPWQWIPKPQPNATSLGCANKDLIGFAFPGGPNRLSRNATRGPLSENLCGIGGLKPITASPGYIPRAIPKNRQRTCFLKRSGASSKNFSTGLMRDYRNRGTQNDMKRWSKGLTKSASGIPRFPVITK